MLWWRGLIPDAGFAFVPKAMNAILCHAAVAENDGTVRLGLAVLSGMNPHPTGVWIREPHSVNMHALMGESWDGGGLLIRTFPKRHFNSW